MAATLLLSLGVATGAQASNVHSFLYKLPFAGKQTQQGSRPFGVAVDNSSGSSAGDVYVSRSTADETQAVAIDGSPSGGTFTLTVESCTTGAIPFDAPAEGSGSVQTALESCVGSGNVSVRREEGSHVYLPTFGGALAAKNIAQMTCDGSGLTGGIGLGCTVETREEGTPISIAKLSPSSSSATFLCQITGLGELAPEASAECDAGAPGPGALEMPGSVAVDASTGPFAGDLYAAVPGRNELQLYQSPASGTYTLEFEGEATSALNHAAGEAEVAAALESLPAIGSTNINVYDYQGEFRITFENELGNANVPQIVGHGVVVSTINQGVTSVVDQFTSTGSYTGRNFTPPQGGSVQAVDVSVTSGNVFIADETNDRVLEWDPETGASMVFAGEAGSPAAPFSSVKAVAVDNSTGPDRGDVYVVDRAGAVVDRFSPSGSYECQITGEGSASTSSSECSTARPGSPKGPFLQPQALAVDPSNGHLYVADGFGGSARILEFSSAGNYLDALSGESIGSPVALAVSRETGDLFDASINNGDELYVYGPDAPLDTTSPSTSVTPASATLNGTVDPLGAEITACSFEYVLAEEWQPRSAEPYAAGESTPCLTESNSTEIGSGEVAVAVHADVSGLDTGKVYHFRISAENSRAVGHSDDRFFGAAYAQTNVATEVEATSAVLNGQLNPDELATEYSFEYGETESYGESVPVSPAALPAGAGEVPVEQAISGLKRGTTYHYRLTATNVFGTTYGADRNFNTLPAALIDPIAASFEGKTTAKLQAYVNPLGAATNYRFEYGKTENYGSSTEVGSVGGGEAPVLVSAEVSGLESGTTYHFRTVVENGDGTVTGPDVVFETEAAECPNEARREEQGAAALALPECRAYEQVSPEAKGGAAVGSGSLALSGERVLYLGQGAFAGDSFAPTPVTGAEYLAHRTSEGWQTEAIHPTYAQTGAVRGGTLAGFDANLERSLWFGYELKPNSFTDATAGDVFIRNADGSIEPASPNLESLSPEVPWANNQLGTLHNVQGESADLSHVLFNANFPMIPSDPVGATATASHLYDIATGPSPTISQVNVDDEGHVMRSPCAETRFGSSDPYGSSQNVISADGSVIYFSRVPPAYCSAPQPGQLEGGSATGNYQIYARLHQSETVSISEPTPNDECETSGCKESPPHEAGFDGASEDGSKALFLDTHRLTDEGSEDPAEADVSQSCGERLLRGPNGCNLYMYDFGRAAGHNLLDLSAGDPTGAGPRVENVLRSSEDGRRVYFVAQGLLTDMPNSLGRRARAGADNLYLYDTATGSTTFIASLCSGEERSGTLTGVAACPSSEDDSKLLWRTEDAAFANHDGSLFIFETYGQLTPDDENEGVDIYRYDAETGALERISTGRDGADANGNGGGAAQIMPRWAQASARALFGAPYQPNSALDYRPMSQDGSTIVFTTNRPLQEGDDNKQVDAYAWHDGQVSLISAAKSAVDIVRGHGGVFGKGSPPVISASGRDIIFGTDAGLVPKDTDGLSDVYDARIGGGFKAQPPPEPPCESAERCHGEATHEGTQPNITHIQGPENVKQCHKGFVMRHGKCVKKRRKQHHKHHRGKHPRNHGRRSAHHARRGGSK